ncbi:MAG: hypothetical protein CMI31_00025 [Opitutae bacterium]|nr:hypothetical protein [Opitutae bacterium]|tara:strand:+ start:4576 stop:5664 length:1089 start_codon:yes stop_codon:yes gene_type:complete
MFYNKQSDLSKKRYKHLLNGALSIGTFVRPNSKTVHLPYELSEQVFCRSFDAENIAGLDVSIDAKKYIDGIGIKTFSGSTLQKIAEFNQSSKYPFSSDNKVAVKQVCEYRNYRIEKDIKEFGLENLTYHLIIRKNGKEIFICETGLDKINSYHLKELASLNNHILKFTDGLHEYSFNRTKSTLYMQFKRLEVMENFNFTFSSNDIDYLKDNIFDKPKGKSKNKKVILPLFSERFQNVKESSGLNQWRADGRLRHHDEVYIPIPARIHKEYPEFFPKRNKVFRLSTRDNEVMLGKICQSGRKALMSNPNKELGKWILRDKLKLNRETIVTKEILISKKIDSVIIEKIDNNNFIIEEGFNFFNQ